jgi:hypothetical protein
VAAKEVAWKEASEAVEKEVEEEKHKKDEEERNNDASPMDTDIPKISTTSANGHTRFSGIDLGLCTPFKPSEVPNLKKFTYDKTTGKDCARENKKSVSHRGKSNVNTHADPSDGNMSIKINLHSLH